MASSFQYSSLENPTDRGSWRATVHGVTKSQTQLKQLGMHAYISFVIVILLLYCDSVVSYTTVCSSIDKHLSCFQFLCFMNKAQTFLKVSFGG